MAFIPPLAIAAGVSAETAATIGTVATAVATVGSIGAGILGTAMSAGAAASQAQSQTAMYNYQAGIALQNQQIQTQNEQYALNSGEANTAQSGMATRARVGGIVAAQAASGFQVGTGTNADVQQSQEAVGLTDQTTIRSNAAKAAYDYDIGAVQAGEQASAYSASAANASAAGNLNVDASIIGGVSSVSSKWLQGTQSGLFGSVNPTNPLSSGYGNSGNIIGPGSSV